MPRRSWRNMRGRVQFRGRSSFGFVCDFMICIESNRHPAPVIPVQNGGCSNQTAAVSHWFLIGGRGNLGLIMATLITKAGGMKRNEAGGFMRCS